MKTHFSLVAGLCVWSECQQVRTIVRTVRLERVFSVLSSHIKAIRISPESREFCFVESGIQAFEIRIQLKETKILLTVKAGQAYPPRFY